MNRFAKIGLFFTLTIIFTTLYIMKTADKMSDQKSYKLYAYLEDASGLLNDQSILVAGVAVGKLTRIDLENNMAKVTLQIRNDVRIFKDALLAKKMQSMLGTSIIYINPGTDKEHQLKEGDFIMQVQSKTSIDAAMENLENLTVKVNNIVDVMDKYSKKNGMQEQFEKTMKYLLEKSVTTSIVVEQNLIYLRATLSNIAELTDKINRKSDKEMEKFSALLATTAQLAETINKMMGDNKDNVKDSVDSIAKSLKELSKQAAISTKAMENVKEITNDIKDGKGNIGKILKDEKLYEEIKSMTKKASDYINSTIGMNVKVDFHTEYLLNTNDFKSYADVVLSPRPDKFYSLGIVDDPKGKITVTEKYKEIETESPPGSVQSTEIIRESEETRESKVKISAQLGRIFGPISIRGGLIQNTAGFGFDFSTDDIYKISTEMFDMGRDENPYWRVYGNIFPFTWAAEPFNWIYLNTGLDDILWADERNFFVGGGLKFTDNDIKALLSAVPKP